MLKLCLSLGILFTLGVQAEPFLIRQIDSKYNFEADTQYRRYSAFKTPLRSNIHMIWNTWGYPPYKAEGVGLFNLHYSAEQLLFDLRWEYQSFPLTNHWTLDFEQKKILLRPGGPLRLYSRIKNKLYRLTLIYLP